MAFAVENTPTRRPAAKHKHRSQTLARLRAASERTAVENARFEREHIESIVRRVEATADQAYHQACQARLQAARSKRASQTLWGLGTLILALTAALAVIALKADRRKRSS